MVKLGTRELGTLPKLIESEILKLIDSMKLNLESRVYHHYFPSLPANYKHAN